MADITNVRQYTDIREDGTFVEMMEVTYQIEDVGIFTLDIPKSEYTAQEAKKRVREEAQEIEQSLR